MDIATKNDAHNLVLLEHCIKQGSINTYDETEW